ncbi:MAG: DUF1330 domain-containing protein [Myxococcota bacterium]
MTNQTTTNRFVENYGDGTDGTAPTRDQWERILARDQSQIVTLVNLFKMHATATYLEGEPEHDASQAVSGDTAFARYAQVSMPAMARVGGRFLSVAPHQGAFLGDEEDWDLIAIGEYPNLDALVALFEDPEYREAFRHRRAACARQRVYVVGH